MVCGPAVRHRTSGCVDHGSRQSLSKRVIIVFTGNCEHGSYYCLNTYLYGNVLQDQALLRTLEPQQLARHKGHFAPYNCLVLGHTKYSVIQRVYSDPFPKKTIYNCHRMPCIETGKVVVSPGSVWYARALLLCLASANTDTGLKSFGFCTGLDAGNL